MITFVGPIILNIFSEFLIISYPFDYNSIRYSKMVYIKLNNNLYEKLKPYTDPAKFVNCQK